MNNPNVSKENCTFVAEITKKTKNYEENSGS